MLVKFNEYNVSKYYHSITSDEVDDLFSHVDSIRESDFKSDDEYQDFIFKNTNIDIFTESEFNSIKKIFKNPFTPIFYKFAPLYKSSIIIRRYPDMFRYIFRIDKLKDEWYILKVDMTESWYKCDQLEGLIKCINDMFYIYKTSQKN